MVDALSKLVDTLLHRLRAARQSGHERPGQDDQPDHVDDHGHRLVEQARELTVAELQRLAKLLLYARAEHDARVSGSTGSPKRRIMKPSRPSTSSSPRSKACRLTE